MSHEWPALTIIEFAPVVCGDFARTITLSWHMDYLIQRLREPSTWSGLAVLCGIAGIAVDQASIGAICAGVAGVLSIILKEGGQ